MPRMVKRAARKVGLPPGSLVHAGERRAERVHITLVDYDEEHFQERKVERVEECFPFREEPSVTWINVDGLHNPEVLETLGSHYGLHPLVMEDILHTGQRPKVEDYGDYLFVVLRMLQLREGKAEVEDEQVSLVLGPNFVFSFQERPGDVFDPVRERTRAGRGRLRRSGADYLAYALVDVIVDHYFLILERMGERIEDLQTEVVANPTPETLEAIHRLKRELVYLRKSIWPLREVIGQVQRSESELVEPGTQIYLRDVYDHTIQVIDTVESYRDIVSGMLDIYLSSVSNRLNEVMKVLTMIATVFIPLSFLAGVYGMNFENMPELRVPWAYFAVLGGMALVGVTMAFFFRRKGWL